MNKHLNDVYVDTQYLMGEILEGINTKNHLKEK